MPVNVGKITRHWKSSKASRCMSGFGALVSYSSENKTTSAYEFYNSIRKLNHS